MTSKTIKNTPPSPSAPQPQLSSITPESIAQSFPVLTLEQVYGALTFYLANKSKVDVYLEEAEAEFEALREAAREQDPMFYQKLADARRRAA